METGKKAYGNYLGFTTLMLGNPNKQAKSNTPKFKKRSFNSASGAVLHIWTYLFDK